MLQAQIVPSKIQLLNQLLQSLSAAPATSNFNLSEIESVFFTHQFRHHHLVHGTNIATPASLEGAPSDTLLGDQLCQWSSVGATADSLLLANHLTVHLPPRIGAYVLANHKTNASLVTDPEVAGQNSRSNYVVKQRSQFRSAMMGSDMALCENHVRRLRTFFTVVLEPNIHTFSVLSETLPDFLKSKLC